MCAPSQCVRVAHVECRILRWGSVGRKAETRYLYGSFVTDLSSREHSVSPVQTAMLSALVCAGLWTAPVTSPVLAYGMNPDKSFYFEGV